MVTTTYRIKCKPFRLTLKPFPSWPLSMSMFSLWHLPPLSGLARQNTPVLAHAVLSSWNALLHTPLCSALQVPGSPPLGHYHWVLQG